MDISCVFSGLALPLEAVDYFFMIIYLFFNQIVSRGGKGLCNHFEMPHDVQRCKISDESIRHALPMGEHIHIFAARSVIRLRVHCRRLHLNVLWMLNGVSFLSFFFFSFLGEGFGGLRHPWLGEDMDCFAAFPLFQPRSQHGTSPAHFWIAHKR